MNRPEAQSRAVWRRVRPCSGMTLIEMIMVVVVIGLILGLTLPFASGLAVRYKMGGARDVLVNYHARARASAVQFGREGRLHIDAANGRFWVEVDTGMTGAVGTDTVGTVLDIAREFGGIRMSSDRAILCFDGRGLPFTSARCNPPDATVVFSRADRIDTVRISLGGTVVQR